MDRNVKFVDGSCDSFGNPAPGHAQSDEAGVIKSGPYAGGSTGVGSRFDYFLPEVPVGDIPGPVAEDMPPWLRELCAGRPLRRS